MSRNPGNSTGPDLALIKKYAEPWDRQSPPVFVGRKEEIGLAEKNCRRAFARFRQGEDTSGHIVLFRGAPGAGKSSLLAQLEKNWTGKIDPLAIQIPESRLKSTAEVVRKIAENVVPTGTEQPGEQTVSTTRGRVAGIFDLERSRARNSGSASVDFSVLAQLKPGNQWDRPVCLLVDEIQTATKDHGDCLRQLQSGEHGLPIVLVAAGLGDSAEKLEQAMSPRLTPCDRRTVGVLTAEEVHSCVRQMFDMCRVEYTTGQLDRIAGWIAKDSGGWPQRVRTATAALFAGLDETRGDLAAVNFCEVDRQTADYRKNSYLALQSAAIGNVGGLVADLLRAMPETGMKRTQTVDIIEAKANQVGRRSPRLPKGMDAEDFLDHLIHQGIFQPDENDVLSCPIPGLRTWLIKRGDALQANLDTTIEQALRDAAEPSEPGRKRRAGPDRDRGGAR